MANSKYYKRTGHVVLFEGDKEYDNFRGLNFKFNFEVTCPPGKGRVAKASVGILGLTADTIYKWASFCNSAQNEAQYAQLMGSSTRSVAVYAGYERNIDECPLFVLPVAGAWLTSPPEMWLNISAYTTKEFSSHYFTVSMFPPLDAYSRDEPAWEGYTLKEVFKKVADSVGLELRWEVPRWFTTYTPSNGPGGDSFHKDLGEEKFPRYKEFRVNGTVSEIIEELNSIPHINCYIGLEPSDFKHPVLYVRRSREEEGDDDQLTTAARQGRMSNLDTDKGDGPIISAETGMIGLPKMEPGRWRASQIEVTSLLRRDIDPGDPFTVKSEYAKYANDTFICTKIKHEGEFRGNKWQTTITGIHRSAYHRQKEAEENRQKEAEKNKKK